MQRSSYYIYTAGYSRNPRKGFPSERVFGDELPGFARLDTGSIRGARP